jgi:PilZ domain-containing protein
MYRETESGQATWISAQRPSDRRRMMRFDQDIRLMVRPLENRSRLIPARIVDLSCGGLRAVIGAELEPGEVLELEFGLRDTTAVVQLTGTIRWREGCQYGMEFLFLTAEDRERMCKAFAAMGCSGEQILAPARKSVV